MKWQARRSVRWLLVAVAATVVLVLAGMGEVWAMGRMCMFSAVDGVVTEHGRPVAGATLERQFKWAWKGETGVDRAQTDAEGRFHFAPVWRSSFLGGLLPHEPSVEQEIRISAGGKSYIAWQFVRASYAENNELFGKPIALKCDLASEPRKQVLEHNFVRHGIYGICEIEGATSAGASTP